MPLKPLPVEHLVFLLIKPSWQEEVKRLISELHAEIHGAVLFIEVPDLLLETQVEDFAGGQPTPHQAVDSVVGDQALILSQNGYLMQLVASLCSIIETHLSYLPMVHVCPSLLPRYFLMTNLNVSYGKIEIFGLFKRTLLHCFLVLVVHNVLDRMVELGVLFDLV